MEAKRRLKFTQPPPVASNYQCSKIKALIHLCHELQLLAEDRPFFLSVRGAASQIDSTNLNHAGALLDGLVEDGVLTLVERGRPGARRASRYRFNSVPESNAPEPPGSTP